MEPAATEDIDVLVSFDGASAHSRLVSLGPLLNALAKRGYDQFEKEGIMIAGFPVQFVPVADDLDREALLEAIEVEIPFSDEILVVRILTAEHLTCIALRVGRPKDKARIQEFLAQSVLDKTKLETMLAKFNLTIKWREFLREFALAGP